MNFCGATTTGNTEYGGQFAIDVLRLLFKVDDIKFIGGVNVNNMDTVCVSMLI